MVFKLLYLTIIGYSNRFSVFKMPIEDFIQNFAKQKQDMFICYPKFYFELNLI